MTLFLWFFLAWLVHTIFSVFFLINESLSPLSFLILLFVSTGCFGGLFWVISYSFTTLEGNSLVQESENLSSHWKREIREKQYTISGLEKELSRWHEVLEVIPFPVLIISPYGNILFSNHAFRKTFEVKNFCWEISSYQFTKALENLLANNGGESIPVSIRDKYFVLFLLPLTENQFLLLMINKTEEILREEKEREFIAHAAHELKTPLSVIRGYLELLEPTLKEEQKKGFNVIKQHTLRLVSLSRDLLSLSRVESAPLSFEMINLSELIRHIIPLFYSRFEDKNLSFFYKLPQNDVFIEADPISIEEVIFNLLENSLRYTDTGEIKLILKQKDKSVSLICKDTGIGIPEKDIPFLFQRFYVVEKSRSKQNGGTGLGLSIVKSIVDRHQGTISVKSIRGKGSIFRITLPLKQPQAPEEKPF